MITRTDPVIQTRKACETAHARPLMRASWPSLNRSRAPVIRMSHESFLTCLTKKQVSLTTLTTPSSFFAGGHEGRQGHLNSE